MIRCKICKREEDVAEPFFDGTCIGCLGKERAAKEALAEVPPPPVHRATTSTTRVSWSGVEEPVSDQFYSGSALIVSGTVTQIIGAMLFTFARSPEMALFGLFVGGVMVLWGSLAQIAGIIRWAIEPLIKQNDQIAQELRELRSRR